MFSTDDREQGRRSLKISITLAIGLVALFALSGAESAFACKCAALDPSKELQRSDAAVVGRLVSVTPRDKTTSDFKYRVRTVVKGADGIRRGQLLVVRSGRYESACGLPPGTGRSYELFLDRVDGHWKSSRCQAITPEEMEAGGSARAATAPRPRCG